MSDSPTVLRRRETATNEAGSGDCRSWSSAKNENEEGSGDYRPSSSSAKKNESNNNSIVDSPSSKPPSPVVKTKQRRQEWAHYADLSAVETIFYIVCATSSILYVCYRVFLLSPTVIRKFANHRALQQDADGSFQRVRGAWRLISPVRDSTNNGWSVLLWWSGELWYWYASHIVLSAALRRFGISNRPRLFILGVGAICFTSRVIGFRAVFSQLAYAFTGLFLAKLTNRIITLWALSICGLVVLNFPDGVPYIGFSAFRLVFGDNFHYESYYIWVITLAHTFNRTISYNHEMIKRNFVNIEDPEQKPKSLLLLSIDLFNYILYFPLFISGPLITYDHFEDDLKKDSETERSDREIPSHLKLNLEKDNLILLAKFSFKFFKFMVYAVFTEYVTHKLYFGVLLRKHEFLRNSLDLWELAGIGMAAGQFFYLKYLLMYGVHSLIAHLDGMTPPKQPKCISRIYLYSDMFRNFDTGLYNFIKRHLYIPLGGSRHGFARQLLTSAIVYSFIYFWHGAEYYIILWTFVNFTTINLESVGRLVGQRPWCKALEDWLGPRMWRRLRVALATPLFTASTVSIFMFIGSSEEILYIYWQRFFVEGWKSGGLFLALSFLYTIGQSSVTFFKMEEKHLADPTAQACA